MSYEREFRTSAPINWQGWAMMVITVLSLIVAVTLAYGRLDTRLTLLEEHVRAIQRQHETMKARFDKVDDQLFEISLKLDRLETPR